jgi:membrane-associated phospholipid phosphatase
MASSIPDAYSRAFGIVELERRMGLLWEKDMQAWIMSSRHLVDLFNGIYVYVHFPAVILIGLWLFFFHRKRYVLFRNAFLISGAIGLIIFNFLPTAPPRLLPPVFGLIDTQLAFSAVNYDMQPAAFVNKYAAMPSLHVGWNLLLGLAVFWTSRNLLLRAFAVVMPIAMFLSTVVTGNHFIIDGLAGSLVALIGLALALALARRGGTWSRLVRRRWRRAASPSSGA